MLTEAEYGSVFPTDYSFITSELSEDSAAQTVSVNILLFILITKL